MLITTPALIPQKREAASLTPLQRTLQTSLTASDLVEAWSGTAAQLKCSIDMYDIVRTDGFPTLADIGRVYGNSVSVQILTNHLQSVMNYAGVDITNNQLAETSLSMLTNYYFLNVAEWCLFFNELKAGKRGQIIWGSRINNQSIMVALHDFAADRRAALDKLEYETRQKNTTFGRIEGTATAIVKGVESVKAIKEKAKTDYNSFRTLFPRLPDKYKAKDLFNAYGGNDEAIEAVFGQSVAATDAQEALYKYLCDYNVKQNDYGKQ